MPFGFSERPPFAVRRSGFGEGVPLRSAADRVFLPKVCRRCCVKALISGGNFRNMGGTVGQ